MHLLMVDVAVCISCSRRRELGGDTATWQCLLMYGQLVFILHLFISMYSALFWGPTEGQQTGCCSCKKYVRPVGYRVDTCVCAVQT